MPRRNIELKAVCRDLAAAREAARRAGATPHGVLEQTDTYFHARTGRLKLRETAARPAELIAYHRPDTTDTRASDYHLVPAPDPATLRQALTAALGVRGVVRKRRELWMWENVRIHLDEVDALGTFVEFEAVLSEGDADAAGHGKLATLRAALAVEDRDLIARSYSDLMGF
jgi:predicted adenylyl cyclase CyaB